MLQDFRFALRLARKNPGSTLISFFALALAIGGVTAIFSVVDMVILRPLPFPDSSRLVRIFATDFRGNDNDVSMPDYLDWERHLHSFSQLALFITTQATLTGGSTPERVVLGRAEASLLPVLGVQLLMGRNFRPEENQPGRDGEAILSWSYWQSHFAGRAVLGKILLLDHKPYRVIGVLPQNFTALGRKDIWLPLTFDPHAPGNQRGMRAYTALGRLASGISIQQAGSEINSFAEATAEQFPNENKGVGVRVAGLQSSLTGEGVASSQGDIRRALWLLFGAVATVLLIACGNVANISLLRTWSRQRELAVRVAVGAGRVRLFRQVLVESVLLSLAAALAGAALATALVRIFKTLPLTAIPRMNEIAVDGRVLGFALLLGAGTGVAFGLLPAFRAGLLNLNETLKQGMGRTTDSRRHQNLRRLFVALETALAALLLIESGLLLKSFIKVAEINPDFVAPHLLTMYVSTPTAGNGQPAADQLDPLTHGILNRIRSLPGVISAAITSDLPLTGTAGGGGVLVEGQQPWSRRMSDRPYAVWTAVTPHYFETMQIRLLAGSDFTDQSARANVAIVNQALVDKLLPGRNPLGKRISVSVSSPQLEQIIGVVANVPQVGLEQGAQPEIFFPAAYNGVPWLALVVRVKGDPVSYTRAIQTAVAKVNGSVATFLPRSMDDILSRQFLWRSLQTWVIGAFTALAITLAGIGIYTVIAHSVNQRISEIGVRVALGASRAAILRMIIWQGMLPALLGAALGFLLSLAIARLTSSAFFGVTALDPGIYFGAVALLLVICAAATYFPALRASRIDPWIALRHE